MNPLPNRKSPRMKGYDYRQSGAYFVTICTLNRAECFGEIVNGTMHLSPLGRIAYEEMASIPRRWADVEIDAWIVMPNHVHAIVVNHSGSDTLGNDQTDGNNPVPTGSRVVGTPFLASATSEISSAVSEIPSIASATPKRPPTLGDVVGGYKAGVTRAARTTGVIEDGIALWQPRYHDHVIRSEGELTRFREYVANNPAQWEADTFFPQHP